MDFKIKSIIASAANTGCHAAKVIVEIEVNSKELAKLKGDLGSLVLDVNNAVYKHNKHIPSYHPSIDPQGSSRAKNGVKTMEFQYFVERVEDAKALGFPVTRSGEVLSYGVHIDLLNVSK